MPCALRSCWPPPDRCPGEYVEERPEVPAYESQPEGADRCPGQQPVGEGYIQYKLAELDAGRIESDSRDIVERHIRFIGRGVHPDIAFCAGYIFAVLIQRIRSVGICLGEIGHSDTGRPLHGRNPHNGYMVLPTVCPMSLLFRCCSLPGSAS